MKTLNFGWRHAEVQHAQLLGQSQDEDLPMCETLSNL